MNEWELKYLVAVSALDIQIVSYFSFVANI